MPHTQYNFNEVITARVVLNKSPSPEQPFALRAIDSGKIGFLATPEDSHIVEAGQRWLVRIVQDGQGYFKAELNEQAPNVQANSH